MLVELPDFSHGSTTGNGGKEVTIIMPLRLSPTRLYDEVGRIRRICQTVPKDDYEILILDYGTGKERRKELDDLKVDFPHVAIESAGDPDKPFSIGHARDLGVQRAKSPVVMFHDIDFLCESETYREIIGEVRLRGLASQGYDYLCVPTIYLTQKGTDEYLSSHNRGRRDADRAAHDAAQRNNSTLVEHLAIGSSATLVNRYSYLLSGGHDRSFVGHGAEDFEFYNRLSRAAPRAARPPNFATDVSFAMGKWEGFRAYYALYGMDLWMRGIAFVHLHHPRREQVEADYRRSSENFKLLRARMQNDVEAPAFRPMTDPYVDTDTLVLADPSSMPAAALRMALPALGRYRIIPESSYPDPSFLLEFVADEGIDQIVFLNPYGNPHRLALYERARAAGIRCYAFDRGALPDSWFFDDAGFLGSSASYRREKWDKPLSSDRRSRIRAWINDLCTSSVTLEKNGERQSADYWRRKLNAYDREVIFVPFQRPKDTATRFFAGPCGSAAGFNEWISELCVRLDRSRYIVIAKKHPLEAETPAIPGLEFVPESANIHDLIDLADKIVLINSGTGVLAIAMQKPIIVCGNAFYAHDGLAYQANSTDELVTLARSPLLADPEAGERFLSYLVEDFYSFGSSSYAEVPESGGAKIRIVNNIDFREIRGLPNPSVSLGVRPNWIPPRSFLFRGVQLFAPAPAMTPSTVDAKKPKNSHLPPNVSPRVPSSPVEVEPRTRIKHDLIPLFSLGASAQRTNGVIEAEGAAGHVVYGPYLTLSEGKYMVSGQLRFPRPSMWRKDQVVIEICTNEGRDILWSKTYPLTMTTKTSLEFDASFDMPSAPLDASAPKLEVRVHSGGRWPIVITRATLSGAP